MTYVTRARDALFGVYAWIVFTCCVFVGLFVALLVPGASRRARWLAGVSRAIFILTFVPVRVNGVENLPDSSCVVVANHASYVDGPLLKGYLPGRFSMVIKGEMRNHALAHFLLRRAGSHFVERNEKTGSTRDARQIVKAAQSGQSLALFPEGTFELEPGLLRFRPGAYVAATRAGMPVVPIAISGTRHILPADRDLPRYGEIRIDILEPIQPTDSQYGDARALAQLSRERILEVLDEPDLLAEPK